MIKMHEIEFYITNVCNLNCNGCNRFNNWVFKGQQNWNDYKDVYKEWSKRIEFDEIRILGGEPTLNPDFGQWLYGLADLWPSVKQIVIGTNGAKLSRWSKELAEFYNTTGIDLKINICNHNFKQVTSDINDLESWLIDFDKTVHFNNEYWTQRYNNSKQDHWPDCNSLEDFANLPADVQDECENIHVIHPLQLFATDYKWNNIHINFDPTLYFYQSSLERVDNNWQWNDSDPDKAYNACYFKTCPHFHKGKMYKCGPAAVLPEFIKQQSIVPPAHAQELISAYRPATISDTDDFIINFIDNIESKKSIDFCRLCPENLSTGLPLQATTKKQIVK